MGAMRKRSTTSFWEDNDEQLRMKKVFSQRRFLWLAAKWHITDLDAEARQAAHGWIDWLYKLQPLIDAVRSACHRVWICLQYLTVDEQRVAFHGRHKGVTYNPRKPIKWGFTMHMVACAASAFVHDFSIYPGKTIEGVAAGLACDVAIKLVWRLLERGHIVIADNWFSSLQLVRELWAAGTGYVGTLRATMAAGFPPEFRPKKKGEPRVMPPTRGEHRTYQAERITATVWGDRSAVKMVSSNDNPLAAATVKRWSEKEHKRVVKAAPSVARTYNEHMGGVDRANKLMYGWKAGSGTKRWWVVLAWAIINIAVHNAFILYRTLHPGEKVTNRQFRQRLAQGLIADFCERHEGAAATAHPPREHDLLLTDIQRECYICRRNGSRKISQYQCVPCGKTVCASRCYDAHRRDRA